MPANNWQAGYRSQTNKNWDGTSPTPAARDGFSGYIWDTCGVRIHFLSNHRVDLCQRGGRRNSARFAWFDRFDGHISRNSVNQCFVPNMLRVLQIFACPCRIQLPKKKTYTRILSGNLYNMASQKIPTLIGKVWGNMGPSMGLVQLVPQVFHWKVEPFASDSGMLQAVVSNGTSCRCAWSSSASNS